MAKCKVNPEDKQQKWTVLEWYEHSLNCSPCKEIIGEILNEVTKLFHPPDNKLPRVDCIHCGHNWQPRTKDPQQCPNCSQAEWWKPHIRRERRRYLTAEEKKKRTRRRSKYSERNKKTNEEK